MTSSNAQGRTAYTCSCCGQLLDGLPQFFMFRRPDGFAHDDGGLTFDEKFACRHDSARYFLRCELELRMEGSAQGVLGFIGWAEVPEATYVSYLAYRQHASGAGAFEETIECGLANAIPRVPGSLGTPIRIRVLPEDPTPYIRWVQPGTPLAERVRAGAPTEYWHRVAAEW